MKPSTATVKLHDKVQNNREGADTVEEEIKHQRVLNDGSVLRLGSRDSDSTTTRHTYDRGSV